MNATANLDIAGQLASACVRREALRHGLNRDLARDRVASRLGWPPGTLYNLLRGRLKKLDTALREALTAYAIEDLQNEIAALSRELESAHRLGRAQDPEMARKAAALLIEARALHDRIVGEAMQ